MAGLLAGRLWPSMTTPVLIRLRLTATGLFASPPPPAPTAHLVDLRFTDRDVLLAKQVTSLAEEDAGWVALLANASSLVMDALPDLNWAGFYLARDTTDGSRELVLGHGTLGGDPGHEQVFPIESVQTVGLDGGFGAFGGQAFFHHLGKRGLAGAGAGGGALDGHSNGLPLVPGHRS